MSDGNDFIISEKLSDNLSYKTYDGGGYVALVRHKVGVIESCEKHGFFEEYMSSTFFVHTLQGNLIH